MTEKIVVENLYKIFGPDPDEAMRLLEQGLSKEEIFERTRTTVGVQNADFSIRDGEVFVVMGLSGSGKSTLVRLLNRLIEPTRGRVLLDGRDITAMGRKELIRMRREHMSMVFQSFALLPHKTVAENAAFGLDVAGVSRDEQRKRAMKALETVGLGQYGDSYPDELSGGMKQRVGLARALATDASILLMDEAFSALDPLIRTEMQDELVRLQQREAHTVVFISHDLDEAIRIGDRIAIMEGGRVVQVGTPEEILNNPADDYVRSFFRGVDVSAVLTAGDIATRHQVTVIEREGGVKTALRALSRHDRDHGYLVDKTRHFHGVVSSALLEAETHKPHPELRAAVLRDVPTLAADTPIGEILGPVSEAPCGLPVVDEEGRYRGVISRVTLLQALNRGDTDHG